MAGLALINNVATQKKTIGTFGGINENEVINENEFAEMKNMSSDLYPAIGPRPARGEVIAKLQKPNGTHYNNGLIWVDGTDFYYKGNLVGTVEDSEKQMVSMGAYVLVWPDKRIYNTSTGEWKSIEKSWTQSAQATIGPTVSASTFIKIKCSGIGSEFAQGDGVEISGCTNSGMNKSAVIQSRDTDYIVVIGDVEKEFTQDSGLTIKRKAPDMDYMTELDNRVWGCSSKNHEVYACKLGDPCNWNCFEGISTDAYAATIGSDGDFTGAATHLGYVLFFKEDMIHKVYGSKPSNIQINSYPARGVKKGCSRSLAIVNATLMYASCDGICGYDGGMPYLISQNIQNGYTGAAGGVCRGKYYVSLERSDGSCLYVYDAEKSLWHKEDGTVLKMPTAGAHELYFLDADGQIRPVCSDQKESKIQWRLESGDLLDGSLDKKRLHSLQFLLDLERGSYIEVYLKYDGEPLWISLKTFTALTKQTFRISVRPRRCNHYRYKLVGVGPGKLYGFGKTYTVGSGR